MLYSPAAQTATTPHERRSVMEAYAGEVSPMLCFEADLQVVRAGGEISLSASRWALAEAAIVADITAAVEEDLDSGDDFSDGADDALDLYFSDDADDGGSVCGDAVQAAATPAKQVRLAGQASSEARGHSSSTQLAVVNTEEAGPSGGPLATVDSSLIAYHQATSKHAEEHATAVEASFGHFKCGCALAQARGDASCLDCFTKGQLRTIHQETYGLPDAPHTTHEILTHIHELYYALAIPLGDDADADAIGRTHKIGGLKLLGKTVCAAAFRRAVGGTRSGHRDRLAMVLRGMGPSFLYLGAADGKREAEGTGDGGEPAPR